jgi:hypothetical protein
MMDVLAQINNRIVCCALEELFAYEVLYRQRR